MALGGFALLDTEHQKKGPAFSDPVSDTFPSRIFDSLITWGSPADTILFSVYAPGKVAKNANSIPRLVIFSDPELPDLFTEFMAHLDAKRGQAILIHIREKSSDSSYFCSEKNLEALAVKFSSVIWPCVTRKLGYIKKKDPPVLLGIRSRADVAMRLACYRPLLFQKVGIFFPLASCEQGPEMTYEKCTGYAGSVFFYDVPPLPENPPGLSSDRIAEVSDAFIYKMEVSRQDDGFMISPAHFMEFYDWILAGSYNKVINTGQPMR